MGSESDLIEEKSAARKEALRALRAAQELSESKERGRCGPAMKFRNYVPQDKELQVERISLVSLSPPYPLKATYRSDTAPLVARERCRRRRRRFFFLRLPFASPRPLASFRHIAGSGVEVLTGGGSLRSSAPRRLISRLEPREGLKLRPCLVVVSAARVAFQSSRHAFGVGEVRSVSRWIGGLIWFSTREAKSSKPCNVSGFGAGSLKARVGLGVLGQSVTVRPSRFCLARMHWRLYSWFLGLLDKELQDGKVAPPELPKFEDPIAALPPAAVEKKEEPLVNIAPKKPNWDLRRDVQKKLERRTQKAMYKLMEEHEKERETAEADEEATES
ncbi:hypothetical protein Bca52824_019281 [Brassica carinata]|uniref:Coiled-coil domain-containing protein 12 n=1 Tax=Brassica carinata TaxID=52824 RepID=A0A8X7VRG4_BRACI|nr:hypothetical protein Bca52824_019281 [Brassica carinata]